MEICLHGQRRSLDRLRMRFLGLGFEALKLDFLQALDLDCIRPKVAKFYGTKANVSEDPVVIMKMMPTPGPRRRECRDQRKAIKVSSRFLG
jgi:hypothetical protein